jgi:hypothetical protein
LASCLSHSHLFRLDDLNQLNPVALKKNNSFAQAWWEDLGQQGVTMGKDYCPAAWIFQMKNRFRQDYRDKHEIEHDAGGGFAAVWRYIGAQKDASAATTKRADAQSLAPGEGMATVGTNFREPPHFIPGVVAGAGIPAGQPCHPAGPPQPTPRRER